MSGNRAEFDEELAATFAEIDRYGQALQPASGTLVLRRSSLRVTAALMPRSGPSSATLSQRDWSLETAMEPLPELPPQPPQRRAWGAAATQLPAFTSSRRRSR